jgi:ABC-2 type transport system ATP-binding protein
MTENNAGSTGESGPSDTTRIQGEKAGDRVGRVVDPALIERRLPERIDPIRLEGITKRYGKVTALDELTFTAGPGEFHCLAGPNASGKTTLAKIAVGLTRPTGGRVDTPEDAIGFGFQEPQFYPDLSVEENIRVFSRATGVDPDDEWIETLESALRLDRVYRQPGSELSGGFQKKLDIAIALLSAPAYLWLDEPLSDVDDVSVQRIRSLLDSYVEAGGGVIVSTHNLEIFETVATHLTVFLDGRAAETVSLDGTDLDSEPSLWNRYRDALGTLTHRR